MNTKTIASINGVEIFAVERENEIFVPIRPICSALGVNYPTQLEKLKDDETFSGSVVPLRGTTGADGKQYEMACLPLFLVYLWLGTINPKNVSDEVRPKVLAYRLECAKALYEHFTGSMQKTIETNNAEIKLLNEINEAIGVEKEAKAKRKESERLLAQLRADRLNPTPSLF